MLNRVEGKALWLPLNSKSATHLMSSKKQENLAARMILARDSQVLFGKSFVTFQGFIGINKEQFSNFLKVN